VGVVGQVVRGLVVGKRVFVSAVVGPELARLANPAAQGDTRRQSRSGEGGKKGRGERREWGGGGEREVIEREKTGSAGEGEEEGGRRKVGRLRQLSERGKSGRDNGGCVGGWLAAQRQSIQALGLHKACLNISPRFCTCGTVL
jgi:hypothetical protein